MSVDANKIKKNRMADGMIGQETLNQVEHIRPAGARLVTQGVLVPGDVLTDDISTTPVLVKAGSILRIEVSAATYIAFGSSASMGSVSASTSPALKLSSGVYLVVATDDFVRASANPIRVEVILG